jgi:hypothetical protein
VLCSMRQFPPTTCGHVAWRRGHHGFIACGYGVSKTGVPFINQAPAIRIELVLASHTLTPRSTLSIIYSHVPAIKSIVVIQKDLGGLTCLESERRRGFQFPAIMIPQRPLGTNLCTYTGMYLPLSVLSQVFFTQIDGVSGGL